MALVNKQTGNYTFDSADSNRIIIFDSSEDVTLTLPNPGSFLWTRGEFRSTVTNIGSGAVTISPETATIDGLSSLTLDQFEGILLYSDDADWFTVRGMGTGGGSSFQPSVLPLPPAISNFSWANQGSSTSSNNGDMIALSIPFTSALNWRLMQKSTAFSAPWSVAAFWKSQQVAASASDTGLYLYDGTKLLGIELLYINTSPFVALRVERITNVTTDGATEASIPIGFYAGAPASNQLAMPTATSGGMFARWRNDGTTLYADYSLDGANWINFYSESVGTFITPTAYGFGGIQNTSGSSAPTVISMQGWLETNSATL